jgi:hypothetical protein
VIHFKGCEAQIAQLQIDRSWGVELDRKFTEKLDCLTETTPLRYQLTEQGTV